MDESVHQAFSPRPIPFGPGRDGLPEPQFQASLPVVPPLLLETFVCLGDTSEFVMRDRWGEVVARFKPEMVERSAGGEYHVSFETALESHAPLFDILRALRLRRGRVRVTPVREQCRFLAQQMTDFAMNDQNQMVERLCTARRDEESFFVGLQNTQVHACELRSPRDYPSEERIERFNLVKLRLGRDRAAEARESDAGNGWDVEAALARQEQEADRGVQTTGIFADRREV